MTNSDRKWTEGSFFGWRFERIGCKVVRSVRYRGATNVAHVNIGGLTSEEIESVGRLIAASPDMAEALRKIERYVLDTPYPSPSTVAELARAALAKAGVEALGGHSNG